MPADLAAWTTRPTPGAAPLQGEAARLDPLDWARDGAELFTAVGGEANAALWRYIPYGPFLDPSALRGQLERTAASVQDPWKVMVVRAASGGPVLGMASFMRIREAHGSAEIGGVVFGAALKRSRIATDAVHLMARSVFDGLGYRRFEWKCHAGNAASRSAALRFGFRFEGVFRNDMVVRGENRDTAWFAMTDEDWPPLRAAFGAWLDADNFDAEGRQRRALAAFRGAADGPGAQQPAASLTVRP